MIGIDPHKKKHAAVIMTQDFTTTGSGPPPVHQFSGLVTLDGYSGSGSLVEAKVGSMVVDTTAVAPTSMYVMLISQVGGVPAEGATLDFYVDGYLSGTSTWHAGAITTLNLSAVSTASYTLQVTISPPGSGYVTKSPNLAVYPNGRVVTLTATASSGYDFGHWSGNAGGNSTSTTVTMNANKSVIANFIVENVSAPVEEPSPAEGFAAISSFLETVYGYKSGEGTGGWTTYNPDWPAANNT
ncbi:hypothetical protein ACFLWZ_00575 [Chloroflexota bacterium]